MESVNTSTFPILKGTWYIYASVTYATIGSDNDLLPVRHQAIIWTNTSIQ